MNSIVSFFIGPLFLSIILVSCGKSSQEPQTSLQTPQKNNSLYGNPNFIFPELTENAKTQSIHWSVYEDFESEVKSLNGNTIEDLHIKTERMVSYIDSLTKKIPDTLFTQAIFSRVLVIKTRTHLLLQELNKSSIDSIKLQENMNELNTSVSNLIIQINEKFQKDHIDLQRKEYEEKELKNKKRFLDSVYQIEIQDKKN
jgi:hypothetical protein